MTFDPVPPEDDWGVPDWVLIPAIVLAVLVCSIGRLIGLVVPRERDDPA